MDILDSDGVRIFKCRINETAKICRLKFAIPLPFVADNLHTYLYVFMYNKGPGGVA
jgi:hypothetical protein